MMKRRFSKVLIAVTALVAYIVGASVSSVLGERQLGEGEFELTRADDVSVKVEGTYIGSDRCIICHREQSHTWAATGHAQSFDNLPERYRKDATCLKCHLTGFGEPGGYSLDMSEEQAHPFQSVGCESCHGPGAAHEEAVRQWTLADPADEENWLQQIPATIQKLPSDSQCATCHGNQAHQAHPPYEGQPAARALVNRQRTSNQRLNSSSSSHGYSVKTCGSCHYVQYQQWRQDVHTDLTRQLTTKHQQDENCLTCHRQFTETFAWSSDADDTEQAHHALGIACEACHGPAAEHVRYNREHITGLRLTPDVLKEARDSIRNTKPMSACVQCHVREGHGQHMAYDSSDTDVAD